MAATKSADFVLDCTAMEKSLAEAGRILNAMQKDLRQKAVNRAVQRTLQAVKAEAGRLARAAYTAHPKQLFTRVSLRRARAGMGAAIVFTGNSGHSLIHFKARPNKPGRRPALGVSAQARRDQPRRVWNVPGHDKPFVMRKAQGGYGVFVRQHGGKAVQMLLGPSPIQALERRDVQERLEQRAGDVFGPRLQHEIDVILAGIAR